MDFKLRGKTALVTGSSAGIGFATARQLLQEGAVVYLNGRSQERLEEAADDLRGEFRGGDVSTVVADLGSAEGCKQVTDALPAVDVLVNNVGIFEAKDFADIPDEDWLRFFQINVMSGVRLTRHYLPAMREAGWGRVVFVSSESGQSTPSEMIHYGMTKTAQLAVARGLAQTLTGCNITVNSVLVGPTDSEGVGTFVEKMADEQGISKDEMERKFFDEARPTSILQRFIEPEEVGNMIAYLCSDAARATTGAALRVDGGVVKSIL